MPPLGGAKLSPMLRRFVALFLSRLVVAATVTATRTNATRTAREEPLGTHAVPFSAFVMRRVPDAAGVGGRNRRYRVGGMRRRITFVAVLLALSVALPAVLASDGAAGSGPRVTMFGDSIAGALSYVPEARDVLGAGIDLRLELAPCRRLVAPGCWYQGARPDSVLDIVQSSSSAELGDIVVIDIGYNDPPNNYDTDMGTLVDALLSRGVAHVVWVTMREETDGYREINEIIRARAREQPRIAIADWESASRGKNWFNPDGLHLNAEGAMALAVLLRPYILAACGSACQPSESPTPRFPRNVSPPVLRGTPAVGRRLTCLPGTWVGTRPIVVSYRWLRSGKVIAGEPSSSRRLEAADRGRLVACRVWAANASGSSVANSKSMLVRPAK